MINNPRVMITVILGGGGVLLELSSGQIKSSGQVWTLRPLSKEICKNYEYKYPRECYNLSNEG
jgi:hypothetical protein